MKRVFLQSLVILAVSMVAGGLSNLFSAKPLAWVFEVKPMEDKLRLTSMIVRPLPEVKDGLYPHQALDELNRKKAVFIDARSFADYEDVHIEGAMPGVTAAGAVNPDVLKLSKKKRLIVYCSSTQCTASAKYADMLRQNGFKDVQVLIHGIDAWKQARYPVASRP